MGIIAIAAVLPLFPSSLPHPPFACRPFSLRPKRLPLLLLLLLLYFKN
jgi:hypothetical protein